MAPPATAEDAFFPRYENVRLSFFVRQKGFRLNLYETKDAFVSCAAKRNYFHFRMNGAFPATSDPCH